MANIPLMLNRELRGYAVMLERQARTNQLQSALGQNIILPVKKVKTEKLTVAPAGSVAGKGSVKQGNRP